jgi:hypothetical protein
MPGVPSLIANGPWKTGACSGPSSSPGWEAVRCTATGKSLMTCAISASNAGSIVSTASCVPLACTLKQGKASVASNAAVLQPWWHRTICSGSSMWLSRIQSGSRTSLTSVLMRVGCIWLRSSTCFHGMCSDGQWDRDWIANWP